MRITELCFKILPANTTADQFRVKIGLEIHARILSKTKIFSTAETSSLVNTVSNTKASYFDAALPGTMPTLNKRCVEAALLAGLSLNCKINSISYFERKHYFYPDMPSGYQITQQNKPIAVDGTYEYPIYDRKINKLSYKTCKIKRIQLEHDSARTILMNDLKNSAYKDQSLIDLNRCGLGLMEIVTEPNFQTSLETSSFVYDLSNLLKSLNVCEVNMKDGGFRCDVNISVHRLDGNMNEEESARVELKNINNLNSIRKSIDYEVDRQIKLKLEGKQHEIQLQTRTYDSITGKTSLLRYKDTLYDYRFMPEPNLLPIFTYTIENNHLIETKTLQSDNIELYNDYKKMIISGKSCEITGINLDDIIKQRERCQIPNDVFILLNRKYHLKPEQAFMILTNKFDKLFIEMVDKNEDLNCLSSEISTQYYNCLFYEYSEILNINKDYANVFTSHKLVNYINLLKEKKVNKRLGKIIFQLMVKKENIEKLPLDICNENSLFVIRDKDVILNSINKIFDLKENMKYIREYHVKEKNREKIFLSFHNQIQKSLDQRVDSVLLNELLSEAFEKRKP